jgi:hypothetical protein
VTGLSLRSSEVELLHREVLRVMRISTGVMIAFALALSCGASLNLALVSLSERRREFATMRVLGMSTEELSGLFRRERVLIMLAGALPRAAFGSGPGQPRPARLGLRAHATPNHRQPAKLDLEPTSGRRRGADRDLDHRSANSKRRLAR